MASDRRRLSLLCALLCTTWLGARPAFAEPNATEKETARQLLVSGRSKRDSGDARGALEDFKRAHGIMKVPVTGLELGRAQAALGQLVEARDTLLEVSRMDVPTTNATFVKARDDAKSLADEISSKIPTLKIEITGVAPKDGTEVTLDGSPMLAESIAMKVNPGRHEVVAKRGAQIVRAEATLAEADQKTISVDLAAQPAAPSKGGEIHPLVWAGFGTAGAGAILGSVFGALSISLYGDVAPACDGGVCPPSTWDDYDRGVVYGWVSTGAFAVAGVGLGLGVLGLFLPSGGSAETKAASARVEPVVTPTFVGVRGTF